MKSHHSFRHSTIFLSLALAFGATAANAANDNGLAESFAEQVAQAEAARAESLKQALPVVNVTARKRNEQNQSVPAAVAVVNDRTLERESIRSVDELSQLTAGLTFDADFGRLYDRPILRGQSTILGESGVSYFVDGVYYTGTLLDFNLADVAAIEVIKGPQSALYGRNTYAGAIAVRTKAPKSVWSGSVKAEGAQFGQSSFNLNASGPLVPNELGVSVSASQYDRNGVTGTYWRNKYDGEALGKEGSKSASLGLYWTPNENVDVRGRLYYSKQDDGGVSNFLQGYQQNNCFQDNGNRRASVLNPTTGAPVAYGPGSVYLGTNRYYCGEIKAQAFNTDARRSLGVEPVTASERFFSALNAEVKLSKDWTANYIAGHNDNRSNAAYDADNQATSYGPFLTSSVGLRPRAGSPGVYEYAVSTGAPAVNFSAVESGKSRDTSHELRLRFHDDKLDFLVGGYFYQSRTDAFTKQAPVASWGDQLKESLGVLRERLQTACSTFFKGRPGFADCSSIVRRASSLSSTIVPFDSTTGLWTTFSNSDSHGKTQNTAFFTSASYKATEQLELSGEVRVARETQEVLGGGSVDTAYLTDGSVNAPFSGSSTTPYQKASFNAVTPRFTARYDVSAENHLYAVAAKGTKPGGINSARAAQVGYGTYDEETAWSYEIGSKNTFLDRRLQLNAALFNTDIKGYQLTDSIVYLDGSASTARKNIGKARIQGVELELNYLPASVRGLELRANYAYTRARILEGVDATEGVLADVADDGQLNCSKGYAPAYAALVTQIRATAGIPASTEICHNSDGSLYFGAYGNIGGRTLPRVPQHALNLGFDYSIHTDGKWVVNLGSNLSYQSKKFVQVDNLAWYGADTTINAHIGISDGTFSLNLWGKNLGNADTPTAVSRYTDATNQNLRAFFGTPRLPRQFGLTGTYKF